MSNVNSKNSTAKDSQKKRVYIPPAYQPGMLAILLILLSLKQISCLTPQAYSFRNKLRFQHGVNFKFNGHIYQNLERVWVVQRINLPKVADIDKLPDIPYLPSCDYKGPIAEIREYKRETLELLCKMTRPSIKLLRKTAKFYRTQLKDLITKDLHTMLYGLTPVGIIPYRNEQTLQGRTKRNNLEYPSASVENSEKASFSNDLEELGNYDGTMNFLNKTGRNKRFVSAILNSFAGSFVKNGIGALVTLAVESISGHLQRKRNKAIAQAMTRMNKKIALTNHELHELEKDFLLYGDYNLNSTENILKVLESIDSRTTLLENWLNGSDSDWSYTYTNHNHGISFYSHQLSLYMNAFRERYIVVQEKLYDELRLLLRSIAILAKGYLPANLFPPSRLAQISANAIQMIKHSHPDYVLALTHVTDYYDMPLVTFGRDSEDRLVVCFPIFLKEFHRSPMTLYQIETVKVPILDLNKEADSYTEVQTNKPYLATNNEHYIQLVLPELRMCKQIRHTHFCEELFLIKHKSKHSCESALYYNQSKDVIQDHCTFNYFYNISVMPSVLDGGSEIVLANFKNKKNLVCVYDQELAKPLPVFEYSLVNRSILCYCHIQIGYTTIPQTISDCNATAMPPFQYTVNLGFWNELYTLYNSTENMISWNISTVENPLPMALRQYSKDPTFVHYCQQAHKPHLTQPDTVQQLRNTIQMYRNYTIARKNFSITKGHNMTNDFVFGSVYKSSFWSSAILHIYLFIGSTIGILHVIPNVILAVKLRKSSALLGALSTYPQPSQALDLTRNVICTHPHLSLFISCITILGLCVYFYRNCRNLTWYRGYRFNNICEIYLFFCTDNYYVPVKVAAFAATPYMLYHTDMIDHDQVTCIKGSYLCGWDKLQINWGTCAVWLNKRKMKLKAVLTIPFKDKIKFRRVFRKQFSLLLMVKHHDSWFKIPNQPIYKIPDISKSTSQLLHRDEQAITQAVSQVAEV